jgi:hypothetical protein
MVMSTNRDAVAYARCRSCEKTEALLVNPSDVSDWQQGKYIQDAMPYLSAAERELLISGTCGDCFDNMFSFED